MTHVLTCQSGTPVSRFAFGTMQFGGRADAAQSRAMYDQSRAHGVTHFDTAYVYTDGQAETLLGEFARVERDQILIATKVGYEGGSGRQNILTQFDVSRKRLGMDQIDLLYLHRFDPDTPLDESLSTLAQLQTQGQIRYIGLSNFASWQVMKAQAIAQRLGTRIDVIQPMYNLVKRQAEVELLPMCASEDIIPVPYSPLGGGLLTGKYAQGGTGRLSEDQGYATRYGQPQMHDTARKLGVLAQELGVDPATLAVAWVARHSSHPVPILSARKPEQLRPSLAAMSYVLTDAIYEQMSALGPVPPPATDRLEEA